VTDQRVPPPMNRPSNICDHQRTFEPILCKGSENVVAKQVDVPSYGQNSLKALGNQDKERLGKK